MLENRTVDYRWLVLVAVLAIIALVGTNMPPIGIDVQGLQDLYMSDFGGSEIPEIALNPPTEDDRQNLTNRLIEEGYEKKDVGIMRDVDGPNIFPTGSEDFLYFKDNIPKIIPISESVVIENLEIIKGEGFKFELRNTASQKTKTPFFILNAVVVVENPRTKELHRLDARRLAWIEISEEDMGPEEKREIISKNPFKILKERDGLVCVEIESMWIEYENFEHRR